MSGGIDHAKARDIFERVCDLPRDAQLGRIDELCAGDELVKRELLSLLEYDSADDDLLSDDRLAAPMACVEDVRIPEGMPERIGEFRILRRIGGGGMGDVYEAEQDSPQRHVALKVMQVGLGGDRMLSRFNREMRILAKLTHTGIAQLYVTGVCTNQGQQRPYFAMELVDGIPLVRFAEQNNLSTRERIELFIRVCDAVEYAHSRGIIHRDLKPDNILVVSGANGPRPKVLDFGVAKFTNKDVQAATMQTQVGQIVGTLSYMCPEQIEGDTEQIDARADVHALGVILFELLTGKRPFEISGKPIHEAARIIREDEPDTLRSFDRTYRGDLDTIVRRATEKQAARRYSTAGEVSADLRRYLDNVPILARQPTALYQLSKFTRRNKILVGGVGATMLVLVIGIIATTWFAIESSERRKEARWQNYRATISAASNAFSMMQPGTALDLLKQAPEEYRGWEWRYLSACNNRKLGDLDGLNITQIATETELPFAYLLSKEGVVTVWNTETRTLLKTIESVQGVREISRSSVGGILVCVTAAPGIVLVDTENDLIALRISGSADRYSMPRLSLDGSHVSAQSDGHISIWETSTGARIASVAPFGELGVSHYAVSPDGSMIAASCSKNCNQKAAVVHVQSGEIMLRVEPEQPVVPVFSPDGTLVVFTMNIRNIHVYRTSTFEQVRVLRGHSGRVSDAAFVDDHTLITVASDMKILKWNAETGRRLGAWCFGETSHRNAVIRSAARGCAITLNAPNGVPAVWDFSANGGAAVLPHEEYIYQIAFSPDSQYLAVAPKKGNFTTIWETSGWTRAHQIPGPSGDLNGMTFSHDGGLLLASKRDENDLPVMHAWDTRTWERVRENILADEITSVAGSADGLRISKRNMYTNDGQSHAKILRALVFRGVPREWAFTLNGVQRDPSPLNPQEIEAIDWNADGSLLATAMNSDSVSIWAMPEMELKVRLPHVTSVLAVCFSPDDTRLATGGDDGIVRIWDTRTWENVLEIHGHESYIFDLQFSPDGRTLASGSGDATVRISSASRAE